MADSTIIQVRDASPGEAAATAATAAAAVPAAVRTMLPAAASSGLQSSGRVSSDAALVRDGQGRSFTFPARMGLSSSMELPGISFEDSSAAPASFANSLENSGVTSVDCSGLVGTSNGDLESIPGLATEGHSSMDLERSLNQSVLEGAFTYESMDAGSPQHDYQEALGSYQHLEAVQAAGGSDGSVSPSLGQGSCAVNSAAFFEASGSVELEMRSSPVDGTQSASASLARTVSILDQSPFAQRSKDVVSVSTRSGQVSGDRRALLAKKKVVPVEEEEEPLRIPSVKEMQEKIAAQRKVFEGQVEELQSLLGVQFSLTGVNPLVLEMGSSVLGSRAVKKPEESLSQEALKSLQDAYAFKDTITGKEAGELSALTGATRTQVHDYFKGQQSRVKRLVNLAMEGAGKTDASSIADYSQSQFFPTNTSALTTLSSLEAFEKLLDYMRAEKSFTGQTNLLELILEADFIPGLRFFLEKGGLRVLARWLSQAANEEQTSLVRLIVKALYHLPMIHALPADVALLVQIMTKLRMYFATDVASKARTLLSKWSKIFGRNGAVKAGQIADAGALGQSSSSSPHAGPEKKKLKTAIEAGSLADAQKEKSQQNKAQPNLKGLDMSERPSSSSNLQRSLQTVDDPMLASQATKKKLAEHGKEKRRVVLVEELSATTRRIRDANARKPFSNDKGSRPLSADDIQKAKMRARLLQGSNVSRPQADAQESIPPAEPALAPAQESKPPAAPQKVEFFKPVQDSALPPASKAPTVTEFFKPMQDLAAATAPKVPFAEFFKPAPQPATPVAAPSQELPPVVPLDAPPALHIAEFLKRVVPWSMPRVINVDPQWSVAVGEESKEKEAQSMRVRREAEEFYPDSSSIPKNPRDPWDVEPDYDDALTLQIPLEDKADAAPQAQEPPQVASGVPSHDPELLALLLKNPALVSELTSAQGLQGTAKADNSVKQLQPVQSGVSSLLQGLQQQQVFPRDTTPPQAHQFQQQTIDLPYPEQYRDREQQQQQQFYHQRPPGPTTSLVAHAPNAGDAGRGPWNALEIFQAQAKQAAAGGASVGGYGGSGGGGGSGGVYPSLVPQARDFNANANGANPQLWNRVSNNNLSFGTTHHQQRQQQHHHHHHQGMEMRSMAHNLDGPTRFARPPPPPPPHQHHHQQQHPSSWFNNSRSSIPPPAPRPGW